jgi:putative transposase
VSHSYISSYYHCVFSTKERKRQIDEALQERLWPYLGGIAKANKMRALAIGGVEDHIHLLLSMPSTISIAESMQRIKGASSKWVHEEFPDRRDFAWQEGYGAFSVGVSQLNSTKRYIDNQRDHHTRQSFEEEYLAFLQKHGIEYDERYVFG